MTSKTTETEVVRYDAQTGRPLGWAPARPGQEIREETVEHIVVTGTVIAREAGSLTTQTITLDDGTTYHLTGVLPAVGSTVTGREETIPSGLLLGRVQIH